MFSNVDKLRQIVCHDLDPGFVETFSIGVAWEYSLLYDALAAESDLSEPYRLEQFGRRRGDAAVIALKRAAVKHAVPYDFMRLDCNGQDKLLVKAGRVILIQESILTLEDPPKPADYKLGLASIHGLVSQLELPLNDMYQRRVRDWSGCVLAVLLHGVSGHKFTRQHRTLGSLVLGVIDDIYSQWVLRLDLHQIAMWGRKKLPQPAMVAPLPEASQDQPDNVIVTPKKKKPKEETA